MSSGLAKLFDAQLSNRDFVIGYFLPVALFFAVTIFLLNHFGLLETIRPVLALLKDDALLGTAVVVVFAAGCATILLTLNSSVMSVLEGYGEVNPFRLLRPLQIRRYKELECKINQAEKSYRQRQPGDVTFEEESTLAGLYQMRAENFPDREEWVLPTSFGNAIRAFEVYPRAMYGLENIDGWDRLLAVIPKDYRALIDETKALTDFWVNLWLLSIAATVEYGVFALAACGPTGAAHCGWEVPWIPVAALVVAWLSYNGARSTAIEWGSRVKASYDVFLPALQGKIGLPQTSTNAAERVLWTAFSQAILQREPRVLPNKGVLLPNPRTEGPLPPEGEPLDEPKADETDI